MTQRILSISGLRGVIGDGLDPEFLVQFATAMGTMCQGGKVVLSRDGRGSGLMVKQAVTAALLVTGCEVIDADIASTPTCGILVTHLKASGGLQITASHNPIQWNGLKPFSPAGSVLDEAAGKKLLDILENRRFQYADHQGVGTLTPLENAADIHQEKVLDLIDPAPIQQQKFKVVLDCNHGSGGVLGPKLLESLGCDVQVMGGTPDGNFAHTPEPLEQNLGSLCDKVKELGADVGFAQDPDADRLAIVDEQGRYIGEELTLALCVDFILDKTPGPVVVNGSTSRVTADIAEKYDCKFHRSKVGEAHVVAKMNEVNAIIGGEGNGGLIDPKIGFVRDSFASMAYVLAGLAERGDSLSQWVDSLPKYTIVKDKVACERELVDKACVALQAKFTDAVPTEGDGLRLDWIDRWVQVRASNTEPIVRIIAEAPEDNIAQELCHEAKNIVQSIDNAGH